MSELVVDVIIIDLIWLFIASLFVESVNLFLQFHQYDMIA